MFFSSTSDRACMAQVSAVQLISVIVGLAGCGGDGHDDAPVATMSAKPVPESVWRSPEGTGLKQLFPASNGSKACVLRGGGPAPGIRVPATCSTIIEERDQGHYQVMLVEEWKARDFSGNDADRPERTYSWTFTISPADEVLNVATQGDFPPGLVK